MVMKSSSANMEAVLVEAAASPDGRARPYRSLKTTRLQRAAKDRSARNDIVHEFRNGCDLLTLEGCFIGRFRSLSTAGELGDKFPAGEVQSLGVFLDFRSLSGTYLRR